MNERKGYTKIRRKGGGEEKKGTHIFLSFSLSFFLFLRHEQSLQFCYSCFAFYPRCLVTSLAVFLFPFFYKIRCRNFKKTKNRGGKRVSLSLSRFFLHMCTRKWIGLSFIRCLPSLSHRRRRREEKLLCSSACSVAKFEKLIFITGIYYVQK